MLNVPTGGRTRQGDYEADIRRIVEPLRAEIASLRAELAALKAQLGQKAATPTAITPPRASVASSATVSASAETATPNTIKAGPPTGASSALAAYRTLAIADFPNSLLTYAKIQNVSATDRLLGRSTAGAGVIEEITCTGFARSLLDDANAAAGRTTLGLGTIAVEAAGVSVTGAIPIAPTVPGSITVVNGVVTALTLPT